MITLAMETSTERGSVAVGDHGNVLFSGQFIAGRGHGSELFSCLRRALEVAPRCDRIVVGLGPGSYSGVRIAIAAVTGLEFALGAEVVGIPSILAFDTDAQKYIAIGDARRATFYFAVVENGGCSAGPMLLDEAELKNSIASQAGVSVLASAPIPAVPELQIHFPSAERLLRLAEAGKGICSRGNLEPIYLRDPHITQPRKRVPVQPDP